MIWDEPARGAVPGRSFHALAGIERVRALLRFQVPSPPLSHLTGMGATQAGAGSATAVMPASPWLDNADETIDVNMLIQNALILAAVTSAQPGDEVVPATLSVHHLRPCTIEGRTFVARARVVNTGPRYTLAEALVEDALGRAVAHSTGSLLISPTNHQPEAEALPVASEEPTYATPDPHLREIPPADAEFVRALDQDGGLSALKRLLSGELPLPPIYRLLGVRGTEVEEGRAALALRTSDWLRDVSPTAVSWGVLAFVGHAVASAAVGTLCPPRHRVGVLAYNLTFLRPAACDGRELVGRAVVTSEADGLLVSSAEIIDADGTVVAVARQTALLIRRRPRTGSAAPSERILSTVLFTDVVDSTRKAEEIGDAAWGQLLAEHHAVVRRQLETWKGKEVKTTGDGFLATFDSPARALQCARGIRDAVRGLGIEVRAGVHTGECEVSRDDVAGIAVHVAARVLGAAEAGEVLVSSTVKDLVTGSGLRFADRGRHELKGIEGDWALYAVAD
jgi:uncharacterized protein (TIGR00369 family)